MRVSFELSPRRLRARSLPGVSLLIRVTILSACRIYVRSYSPEMSGKHPTFFDYALWHATCAALAIEP